MAPWKKRMTPVRTTTRRRATRQRDTRLETELAQKINRMLIQLSDFLVTEVVETRTPMEPD
jgi:hypothetical protein